MRKLYRIISIAILLVGGFYAKAQNSLSFYHLGDATYQNSSLNPAYVPNGRVFIGLPALSGVHVGINNKFSYNQLISKEGNTNTIKISSLINELQKENMMNAQVNISLLHLGYRFQNGMMLSVFANERIETDVLYPKALAEFLFEGNTANLGETIEVGSMGINATHFREMGIGFAHELSPQLKVGVRLKMLQGFFNYSTPSSMVANLKVDPQTYAWELEAENIQFRSSGLNTYGDNLVSAGNSGFGLDLGFEYNMSKYLGFAASITDIGFITWSNDIQNRVYEDTKFSYAGVDIKGINNLETTLTDSLFDQFKTKETSDGYKTWLPTKAYGSVIYRYTPDTHFIGTVGARYVMGELKMLYGGGVRQKLGPLTASVSAMRMPQHFFNLGAALAVRGGPVQYYVAADGLLSLSVPDAKTFDFRMGLNFIIGKSPFQGLSSRGSTTSIDDSKSKKGSNKGVSTGSFLGKKVKTKKREGIYSVIGKQKKRKIPKSLSPPKNQKNPNKRN